VKPAPTILFFWISRWAGAGFLSFWFFTEMVGETRPYNSVLLDFSLGGGGFFILLVFHRDG
jgi:hypothetical protein